MSVLAHVQRLARQDKQKVDEQRREKHLPVAEARQQVALWRSKNLCSADYIEAWESLLNVPVQAAEVLEDAFSSSAVQLRQNSPFVASVRRFKIQLAG